MPFGGHPLEADHRYGALTRWGDRSTGTWVSGTPFSMTVGFHNCKRLTIGLVDIQNLVSWTQPIELDVFVRWSTTQRLLTTLLVSPAATYLSDPLYIVGQDVRVQLTSNAADDGNNIAARLVLMASA